MTNEHWQHPLRIIGLELRTDNQEAFSTVPQHWQKFMTEIISDQIPDKTSNDLYAIYTHYTNQGVDNNGTYSLIIGSPSQAPTPNGLTAVELPASKYQVHPVKAADQVGIAWQEIWQQDTTKRTFITDFERYAHDGSIEILLGIHD